MLRRARVGVLRVLHGVLSRTADVAAGRREAPPDWPLSAVDRVHEQLGGLIQARTTARQVVRVSPRRWGLRDCRRGRRSPGRACGPARRLGAAAGPCRRARGSDGCRDRLPQPVQAVLVDLAAATALADSDPAGAAHYAAAARQHASTLQSDARERTEVVLADVVAGLRRRPATGDRPASGVTGSQRVGQELLDQLLRRLRQPGLGDQLLEVADRRSRPV